MNTFYQVLIVYGIIGIVSAAIYYTAKASYQALSLSLPKDGEL